MDPSAANIFSRTDRGCLEWFAVFFFVPISVGLALLIWSLWPDNSAYGMTAVGAVFFVMAAVSLSRVISGPFYLVRLSEGDLVIERRWLWWWTHRRHPLSEVAAVRIVEMGEASDGFTVKSYDFLDPGGKKITSVALMTLANPRLFIKAVREINPSIELQLKAR